MSTPALVVTMLESLREYIKRERAELPSDTPRSVSFALSDIESRVLGVLIQAQRVPAGELRQVGSTTEQMRKAPPGATYVWLNGRLDYPRNLARSLHREDLRIVSPVWVTEERWRGLPRDGIVLDHATKIDWELGAMMRAAGYLTQPTAPTTE